VITASVKNLANDSDKQSSVQEDDEWTAIQNFNALLYYEEQK
jgi:hypothetical protein